MAKPKIRLDKAGIAEVLRSPAVEDEVRSLAASVAGNVSVTAHDGPVPVELRERTAQGGRLMSPRLAVDVILAHPGGLGLEAKYGTLTKAASAAGLPVKRRK